MNDIAVITDADKVALDDIDVSDPKLYQDDVWYPYFARLRREAPVHYCRESLYGPYWSLSKYKDIMQVEINTWTGRALSAWTRRAMTSSAWWSARSSPRATSPTWKA